MPAGSARGERSPLVLDTRLRRYVDPPVERLARGLAARGVGANAVTLAGFAVGAAAAGAIAAQAYLAGLALILLSRLCDGLDGAVARATPPERGGGGTDLGGYLDIVLDFAFYGLVPLGFVLADPAANGVAGAVLLTAFYVNGASFLAFALIAEKRGLAAEARGSKAFLYTAGLAEASETLIAFALMCLFPAWFAVVAYVFAVLTLVTTLARLALAARSFR